MSSFSSCFIFFCEESIVFTTSTCCYSSSSFGSAWSARLVTISTLCGRSRGRSCGLSSKERPNYFIIIIFGLNFGCRGLDSCTCCGSSLHFSSSSFRCVWFGIDCVFSGIDRPHSLSVISIYMYSYWSSLRRLLHSVLIRKILFLLIETFFVHSNRILQDVCVILCFVKGSTALLEQFLN